MPVVSAFFGVVIRMYYDEHNPPHFHAEFQNRSALFDFHGNILQGSLESRTATKLVREWADLRFDLLKQNWDNARDGKELLKIDPLN